MKTIHKEAARHYGADNVYVVGNSTSDYDLSSSFSQDNLLISILSALFVIIILLFTFKSAGLPVLLILVIQGSIWINFSFPYLMDEPLYFLSYLIVNSIQMGANIDYAIVISSHYKDLKSQMHPKKAIVAALNEAFPTIFTSGSILAGAGALIGQMTTNPIISAIGNCLSRGTVISILLVLAVLPQILVLGDHIIERTSFELNHINLTAKSYSGLVRVQGRIKGQVNGTIEGSFNGILRGDMEAVVIAGSAVPLPPAFWINRCFVWSQIRKSPARILKKRQEKQTLPRFARQLIVIRPRTLKRVPGKIRHKKQTNTQRNTPRK